MNRRSGCGIMHRWRPSGDARPTMASCDPLGLNGYVIVGSPSSSTYFITTQFCFTASSCTLWSGQKQRPSPCATHTPSVEPSMPYSMIALLCSTRTFTKRDSKRPDLFCTKRGCFSIGRFANGTTPSCAISWQPLHTPSENVSGRA